MCACKTSIVEMLREYKLANSGSSDKNGAGDAEDNIDMSKFPLFGSCRLALIIMMFISQFTHYFVRLNLSIAIVCMVDTSNENNTDLAHFTNTTENKSNNGGTCGLYLGQVMNESSVEEPGRLGEFDWSRKEMTGILAGYFYGYVIVQILGGYLASRFGGKHVNGTGILLASILTLLTPLAARTHHILLLVVRVFIGVGTGVTVPSTQAMFGRWLPKYERTVLIGIALAGAVIGAVFAFGVTGLLCTIKVDNGWPFAFYIPGAIGVLWWMANCFLVYSSPHQHPRISEKEKKFILQNIGEKEHSTKIRASIPWRSILASMPVWGFVMGHISESVGFYTALVTLPMYVNDVLLFNIEKNGFLSALPQICLAIASPLVAFIVDIIRSKQYVTTGTIRKICQLTGMSICTMFYIGASFLDCEHRSLAMAMITIAVTSISFARSGYMVNNVDIAPRFSGLIFGLSNTFANVSGFLIPLLVGALTPDGTREQWQKVFYIHSGIIMAGTLGFVVFSRGEVQNWAKDEDIDDKDKNYG